MQTLTDATFTEHDQAMIRQMFESSLGFIKAGDWSSWAEMYADDGVLQPPHAPSVRGRPALVEWGRAFPPIEALAFSRVEIFGEGNVAWATSVYALKVKDQAADTGKQLVVFRRMADGKWKLVVGSFNSDLPVA